MSGRYERKKPKQNQKPKQPLGWKKVVLIVIAVILVLIVAALIAGIVYYNTMLNKINRVEVPKIDYTKPTTEATENTGETSSAETTEETTVATEPHVASSADYLNILVIGQAARDGEAERFADTMILCTINTYEKTLTMTSLLRDTLVQYPDYTDTAGKSHYGGKIKLTTIYHNGYITTNSTADAMGLMNLTLYKNFGIEVDYDFEIDFEAFVKIVNMLGGVDIELTEAEADYLNADGKVWQEVEPGKNWLDGDTALAYARMRKAAGDNESDIVRTERQRKFIETILAKLKKKSLSELQAMANEVLPMITTSMSKSEITEYMLTLLPMLPEMTIKNAGNCPVEGSYWGDFVDIYGDGMQHSVLQFDQTATTKAMRAITEGEEP